LGSNWLAGMRALTNLVAAIRCSRHKKSPARRRLGLRVVPLRDLSLTSRPITQPGRYRVGSGKIRFGRNAAALFDPSV
jgi:hypothetical protein